MSRTFEGSRVLITGASSGIGAATARAFAAEGAKVALAARRLDRLEELREEIESAGGQALAVECDVTDRASIEAAVDAAVGAWGGLDVVLANAGFGVSGLMQQIETDDYRRQFEVNVFGLIDTIYAVLPHLRASRGRLGLLGSVVARVGFPSSSAYTASKFAVAGLAESIAYELAEAGVSVTLINPGVVASEFRSVDNRGRQHADAGDPAPNWLIVPTDRAARTIVRALYKRRFEVVVTGHGKAIVFFARHFPTAWRFIVRIASRGRMAQFEKRRRGDINAPPPGE
jgi:NADP-dependent 3-hydroxy acid dehydrogenase YdfG